MGDVRIITNPTTNAAVVFGYLVKSPWGGDGWILSVVTFGLVVHVF